MKNPKILVLLVSLVVFINYINYMVPDRAKLYQKITLLHQKIKKDEKLNNEKIDIKTLKLDYDKLFFDTTSSYSQAMGKFQEMITKSAKGSCKVSRLKWAQVPISSKWYDILRIDLSLECSPKSTFKFINNLRSNDKIFYLETLKVYNVKGKLRVNLQLITYRKHDEK